MFQYAARIVQVIDGDTLKIDLDLGFRCHLFETIRLAHINTPEIVNYDAGGIVDPAKNYIMQHCPPGSMCVVGITRQEKYGRWLADLFFLPGESDPVKILQNARTLNGELVMEGFAMPYEGGRK